MNQWKTVLPITLSIIAIGLSVLTYFRSEAMAKQAVAHREKQLVDQLKPKMAEIYHDFDMVLTPDEKDPRSLDTLFGPMLRLIEN